MKVAEDSNCFTRCTMCIVEEDDSNNFTHLYNILLCTCWGNFFHPERKKNTHMFIKYETNLLSMCRITNTNTYDGESNENLKSAIKIRNTARLSSKLTTMILMA